MNVDKFRRVLGTTVVLRPRPKRGDGFVDDSYNEWVVDEVADRTFRFKNSITNHELVLARDSIDQFRTPNFVFLRGEATLLADGKVHFEPKAPGIKAPQSENSRLHYWATHWVTRGIFAVLLAFGVGWAIFKGARLLWPTEELRLVSCNTLGSAVLANRGDDDVFISHLILSMPGRSTDWQAKRLDVKEFVKAGGILRREFPKSVISGPAEFIRAANSDEFNKLVSRAANGDPCLELAMFTANDDFFTELKKMAGPQLNTFEVGGFVQYWISQPDYPKHLPINGSGVVRRAQTAMCLS